MKRKICSTTIMLIIIIIGLFKLGIVLFEYKGEKEGKAVATIYEKQKDTKYMKKYVAKINNQKVLLYVKKGNLNLDIGDIIEFKGELSSTEGQKNYKGFDYSLYLKTQKISGVIRTEKVNLIGKSKSLYVIWKREIYNNKIKILNIFKKNLNTQNSALLSGILIGEDSDITNENMENFKRVGLTHVLAISGENFLFIVALFNTINKKIRLKRMGYYATIIGVLFFMELTGNSASVIRAGIMCMLAIIAKLLHRKYDFWTSLSISVLVQIIYNPYSVFDIGLILSYGGVIGIIALYESVNKIIKSPLLCTIICANIIIIPISVYNFNQFSFIFIISNFFSSIIIEIVTILGFISVFFRLKIIYCILDFLLTLFTTVVNLLAYLPLSSINVTTPSFMTLVAYYIFVFTIANREKIKKCYRIIIVIGIITTIVFNISYQILNLTINEKLLINFIDVGQGDCTLIRYKNLNILIDGGGNLEGEYDIGKNILIPYLLDRKIMKLDYIIVSHFDTDHVGGIISVLEELKVRKIIISKQGENSENYIKVKELSRKKQIPILVLNAKYNKKGKLVKQTLKIKENLIIDILWPNESKLIENNVLNNNSIVCKLKYKNFSMLFTGDIEEFAEKQIVNEYNDNELKSTVLKVGHHGSKTSSIQEFLNSIKPKIALIGVGKDNKFGHPDDIVIERLEQIKCKIYRTDIMGEISIQVDKECNIKIKNKMGI